MASVAGTVIRDNVQFLVPVDISLAHPALMDWPDKDPHHRRLRCYSGTAPRAIIAIEVRGGSQAYEVRRTHRKS
jgi:hypothetical protein